MPRPSTAESTVETLLHNDPLFNAFYHAADRLRVVHPRHGDGPSPWGMIVMPRVCGR